MQEVSDLQSILDDISYTCGTTFDDLELPGRLTNVFVKDHNCADSIEKLYYSCGFEPICVHCASEEVEDTATLIPSTTVPRMQPFGASKQTEEEILFSLTLLLIFLHSTVCVIKLSFCHHEINIFLISYPFTPGSGEMRPRNFLPITHDSGQMRLH